VIEHGLALHVPIFIVDKGMPGFLSGTYSDPVDVGRIAKKYPDARFIVRHAAFEHGLGVNETSDPDPMNPDADLGWGKGIGQWPEGPYDEDGVDSDVQAKYPLTRGVNSLIKSLRDNGIAPNSKNVYVSLDEVWAHLITRPTEAAHVLGKLMKYVGEDNILFGTGSMYYGKPDPQVQKFRDFEISDEMQQRFGYPALTEARKQKILGLNAARLFCSAPR
jgi:predicted TIM-barrel fold metal-dependent hydrolase